MKHIDTLYTYRIIKGRDEYLAVLNNLLNTPHVTLGDANGRQWIELDYCRIGVMDWDKANRSNNYSYLIQYDWDYLYNATVDKDVELIDLQLPLGGRKEDYKVNRIDFSITKFDTPIAPFAITPFRSRAVFEKGGEIETVYFGKRSNGVVYRVYDKTKEMKAKENYKKMDYLSSYFGSIEQLTVFELEMHRKYFINKIEDFTDNLNGLPQLYAIYALIVGDIRHFYPTEINLNRFQNNNYDDIEYEYNIANFLSELSMVVTKKSNIVNPPSMEYLLRSIEKKIRNYSKSRKDIDILEIIDRLVTTIDDDIIGENYQHFGYKYRSLDTAVNGK